MSVFPLWLYVLATFMVKHSKQIERKYEITFTFTGIPWSNEYAYNQTAVDMLLRGQLQADNSGIKQELENAFRGQSDFIMYQSLYKARLWNDLGKVRTNRNALIFGGAVSSSTDPLVTLLRVLEDGKLGTLSVDMNTFEITEHVTERKFEITVTFIGIPWSDEYQDGANSSAVARLISQLDNAGIRQELQYAFRAQPHFMRYQSLHNGRLWNDSNKVRTNRNGLIFGGAFSNAVDPLVTLLSVVQDGKLGTLTVDKNTLELKEYYSGYQFSSWKTTSGSCSSRCCVDNGSITQSRSCRSKVSGSCSGVLFKRELSCVDFCKDCSVGQRPTTVALQTTATVTGAAPTQTTWAAPAPTAAVVAPAPTKSSTSERSEKPSCASIIFIANQTWNASFGDTESELYKNGKKMMSMMMEYLYNDSKKYDDVEVSDVVFTEKDSLKMVKAKLCLVVKTNGGSFIEDVFIAKVKTGYLHPDFPVKSGSAEYKPEGVNFKDWKAKDDECDKCDGAAGEFVIEATCEDDTNSCKGQKTTDMSKDCVKYCPSSAAAFTISIFVLVIAMLFSFR